jgi:DNA-binding response OmpR family regulator
MHILIIEDNLILIDSLHNVLKKENYLIDEAKTGDQGYTKILDNNYDLIILDIMLPNMNGFEILECMQQQHINTPVLILSAKNQVEDKVKALDLGSYDYLTKPFAIEELLARIRGIFRRRHNLSSNVITIDEISIDTNKKTVKVKNEIVELTNKEYEILELLSYNCNKAVSRIAIGEHVWGENLDLFTMSNFIDVHIKNIRKKIEGKTSKEYIRTIRGFGFILSDNEKL